MTRLLLVEDDAQIVQSLRDFLREEGYEVRAVGDKRSALAMLEQERFDLALLDVSLPDGSGLDVCRAIKDTPVVFLTASDDENSVVAGLDLGADDYIIKPFRPRELASRLRSVLRRSGGSEYLSADSIRLDPQSGTVTKDGREIPLSALQYRLLLILLENKGKLMTRERLLADIWDISGDFVNDNTLTVYVKRLREKLEDESLIKTVRGIGYRIDG